MPSALTSKTMWRAILITIVMHTLGRIVSHICWQHVDSTIINAVPDDLPQPQAKESDFRTRHSFYLKELPIEVLCGLPIAMLAYRWHYLLEKMWPSRPRHSHISTQQAEKKVESDDELEEEIMRKLIAKGKVRRSSISWCNTLLKWSISNVLGTLLFNAASVMLIGAFKLQTPATTWPDLKDNIPSLLAGHFISGAPLISLLSFVLVPWQYRLPVEAATDLAWKLFFGAFLYTLIPWLLRKDFMQDIIRNATESAIAATETMNGTVVDENRLLGTGEL